jgi:SAM-dependent methyltransferase
VDRGIAESWDAEYEAGRYVGGPPVEFVGDIVEAARRAGLVEGVYIGCGNGRNYLPLVAAGLELVGLDLSARALNQLAERAPERRGMLVLGDVSALPRGRMYSLVIGLQVFQHGDRAGAHAHIRSAMEILEPGGLFCLRVNAVATDVAPRNEVTERHRDGGFTVRYLEGPKQGLLIHFFSLDELNALFDDGYEAVLGPRLHKTLRAPPGRGQWSQWEAIWRKVTNPN